MAKIAQKGRMENGSILAGETSTEISAGQTVHSVSASRKRGDVVAAITPGKRPMLPENYRPGAAVLADAAYKPENQMTAREKIDIIRAGVSKKDLEGLKEIAKLDYDALAKSLSVTRATLINKKREEKFNAVLSERILALADIYSYGYEVFEDEARFNQWMFRPNHALGGQAPFELMDNQFGREEVRNIIGRIDYGVYS